MRKFFVLFYIGIVLSGCSPKITSSITSAHTPLAKDAEVMNIANSSNGSLYGFREDQLASLGYKLTNNFEVISVTNNHVVNLRGITYGYKLKMFFGGIGNKLHLFSAYVHDPNKGYTVTSYLQTVGIIHY